MYEFGHISHHIWLCVSKVGDSQHSLPVSFSPCFGWQLLLVVILLDLLCCFFLFTKDYLAYCISNKVQSAMWLTVKETTMRRTNVECLDFQKMK